MVTLVSKRFLFFCLFTFLERFHSLSCTRNHIKHLDFAYYIIKHITIITNSQSIQHNTKYFLKTASL